LLAGGLGVLAVAFVVLVQSHPAAAQNSLGIGGTEQPFKPEGVLAPFLFWVKNEQQHFYLLMQNQLKAMRHDGSHVWWLIGLSLVYGVFHAIGPGHGKAVISSYMIANEVAARRGIVLSFASAFAQAMTAIVLVAGLVLVLRGYGLKQADATRWLEVASYAAITALGAWLLWSKIAGRGHGHDHGHDHAHVHHHPLHDGHEHHDNGPDCGHSHAPEPVQLGGGSFSLRQAWSAILAVGLRPCSGALIVATFAFLNGLYLAGIASTFAMALGTGITVATLAALSVWAKDLAIGIGGAAERGAFIHRVIEIGGAGLIFVMGLMLLSASLYG
jgi:ABC-type nickel/cobalt efflux system permease component RcnA